MCWFAHAKNGWEAESERTLNKLDIPTERWSVDDAAKRFPTFDGDDLAWVLHEPEAGVLRAQKAVQTLVAAGAGPRRDARAGPGDPRRRLRDRQRQGLEGDRVVWS